MAVPTFASYDLGEMQTPSGTLAVVLYSEVAGMTVPTRIIETIGLNDWIEAGFAVTPEGSQLDATTVELDDDYTVYAEGFWFKVLTSGKTELRFYIDEGEGDTFLFWGRVVDFDGRFIEHSIVGDEVIRTCTVRMVDSLAERLHEVTAQELYDILDDASYYEEIGSARYVNFQYVYSGLLNAAYGQTIDIADIDFDSASLMYSAGGDWRFFENMSIRTQSGGGPWVPEDYFETWINNGFTGMDILRNISLDHQIYPRHDFTVGGGHEITMISKGSSSGYLLTVTLDAPIESTLFAPLSPNSVKNIQVLDPGGNSATWVEDNELNGLIPAVSHWDVQLTIGWGVPQVYYVTGGVASAASDVRHWEGGWSSADGSSEVAVSRFIRANWGVMAGRELYSYEREYFGIGADDSLGVAQENIRVGKYHDIDDGVSERPYMAMKVAKHISAYRLRVTWREIV